MDKKYGDKGLRIIAPEVQESAKEDVKKIVDEKKIAYTITRGIGKDATDTATEPKGLADFGIPFVMVFDTTGKMVFQGKSSDPKFDEAILESLKAVKVEKE